MKKVIIDFTGVKYIGEMHKIIKESFQSSVEGFPDFYGENLDALWDCLTGFIETPVEVVLTGINNLNKEFNDYLSRMIKVFKRADEQGWGVHFRIE